MYISTLDIMDCDYLTKTQTMELPVIVIHYKTHETGTRFLCSISTQNKPSIHTRLHEHRISFKDITFISGSLTQCS